MKEKITPAEEADKEAVDGEEVIQKLNEVYDQIDSRIDKTVLKAQVNILEG